MTPRAADAAQVLALAAEVRALLDGLAQTHVRAFLREWPQPATACRVTRPCTLPVLRWHPEAGPGPGGGIVAHLHALRDALAWSQTYRAEDFGAAFLDRYGWTELIGTRGPIASATLACGFLLLGPDTEYPDHHHAAEEIYVALSGTASWRRGDEQWAERPPATVIHHPSNASHAMRTGREALLALYLWRGGDLAQKPTIGEAAPG